VSKDSKGGKGPATLEQIRKKIRARYERPVVVYQDDVAQVPIYKTRFPKLNALLGGGIPGGAIIEIYGPEDSCKSTLAMALAADIQQQAPEKKKHVELANYERRQPWRWWRTLGLDTSKENFTQLMPRSLEEGMGDTLQLVETGSVCAVVIDSVFAAGSREGREAVKAWSDPKAKKASLGVEARKWGEAWTAIVPVLQDTDTVAIAVNQIRDVIDTSFARAKPGMEKPTTTPRGRALKFYSWLRLEARARNLDPERFPGVDGRHVRLKVIKNGVNDAARGRVELDLVRGEGFDLVGDLIDFSLESGAITASGSWYYVEGKRVANGQEKLRRVILEHPNIRAWLEKRSNEHLASSKSDAIALENEEVASKNEHEEPSGDVGDDHR
jgi:recombination protein RecA